MDMAKWIESFDKCLRPRIQRGIRGKPANNQCVSLLRFLGKHDSIILDHTSIGFEATETCFAWRDCIIGQFDELRFQSCCFKHCSDGPVGVPCWIGEPETPRILIIILLLPLPLKMKPLAHSD